MKGDAIWSDGRILAAKEAGTDVESLPGANFIYQRIHTLAHKGLHLNTATYLANNSYKTLYGTQHNMTATEVGTAIESLLAHNRYPQGSVVVTWYLMPPDASGYTRYMLSTTEQLLYKGYVTWHSRVPAMILPYEYPFPSHKSAVSLAANNFAQWYASSKGAQVVLTESYDHTLTSAGENPLFALHGRTLLTPPVECGAADSVERRLGLMAATSAGIEVVEAPIPTCDIVAFDELLTVTPQGVVSIKSCGEALYMNIIAQKLGTHMAALTHADLGEL